MNFYFPETSKLYQKAVTFKYQSRKYGVLTHLVIKAVWKGHPVSELI